MNKNSSPSDKRLWRMPQFGVTLKFTLVLGIVMILVAVVQVLYSTNSTRRQIEAESLKQLESYINVYDSHVEAESNASQALASSIADRKDIQELYRSGDREGLYKLLQPMFEELKKRQIVHLYIENPDGTVFLRVHDPKKFGDDITYRKTAADALEEGISTAGIEIGPNRMGIRGVAPMTSNGKFIGLIEVGIDFDQEFISTMKQLTGADYTIWVTQTAAAPAGLKPVEGSPTSSYDGMFYYASTNENLLPVSSETYRLVLEKNEPQFQIYTQNVVEPSMVYLTPLLGYKGKLLGVLEISFPYADTLNTQNTSSLTIIAITGGLNLLGLIVIIFFISQVVLKPLATLSIFANNQLEGNLGARVSVRTGDEFERLADSFNDLAATIEEERQSLEQRVTARTSDLATVAEVGSITATILESKSLLQEVVDLTKDRFNLYHSHIYLLDENGENLVLTAGAGEPGRVMVAEGRSISLNREQSLVARAARERKGVTVNDVTQAPDFLPNSLLPDTHSELAVPMIVGGNVIGVFDIQSEQVGRFTDSDINIQTTLAAQLATSIQNVRQFEQSKSQADLESLVNAIGQKIQRTTTVDDTLQTAIREIGLALGASRVSAHIQTNRQPELSKESVE